MTRNDAERREALATFARAWAAAYTAHKAKYNDEHTAAWMAASDAFVAIWPPEDARPPDAPERANLALLRNIVDRTWGRALMNTDVPSTKIVNEIVEASLASAPAPAADVRGALELSPDEIRWTQALKEPSEDAMREARELFEVLGLPHDEWSEGHVARALDARAAQEREQWAKWHDEQGAEYRRRERNSSEDDCWRRDDSVRAYEHEKSAAAIRTGQRKGEGCLTT